VPVGCTATVRLPGADHLVQVGHGEHHWNVEDTAADRPERPEHRHGSIRELLDDEATWARTVAVAEELGAVTDEQEAASRLAPFLDAPVTAVADALARFGQPPGPNAIRDRLDPVLGLAP
jgi:hypothetical protein